MGEGGGMGAQGVAQDATLRSGGSGSAAGDAFAGGWLAGRGKNAGPPRTARVRLRGILERRFEGSPQIGSAGLASLEPNSASKGRRRSISSTALRSALVAFLGSTITGVSRCGMPSHMPNLAKCSAGSAATGG